MKKGTALEQQNKKTFIEVLRMIRFYVFCRHCKLFKQCQLEDLEDEIQKSK